MMQVIPKWRVFLTTGEPRTVSVTVYVSDRHWQNVLRKLADLDFAFQPVTVEISREPDLEQIGVRHGE